MAFWSFLGNEFDFRNIMNVFPNTLAKNENFKKLRHVFVDDNDDINIFLSLKNPCTFCSQKKRPENEFLTLTNLLL